MSWLLGHSETTYTHHASPIQLSTKSSTKTTLPQLAQSAIPPCRLNPLLFNGHLQTIWTAVKDAGPPIHYKRHLFQSTHSVYSGQFSVDFVVPPRSDATKDESLPERTTYFSAEDFAKIGSEDDRPMLICLHGLTGGSHEVYLRQVVAPLTASGWEACVVNGRGCALTPITGPHLFSSRSTWDVRQVVKWLRTAFPNRPLYGVGFSLGANILTTYVAEEGRGCELKAAVACSNPWNLELCNHALMRTWAGRELYSRTMGGNLMGLFEKHKEQILKNKDIDVEKAKHCRYIHEFDRYVQAPTWGYPTEGAYYRDAQSVDAITAIRIPFLGINAEDDPISNKEAIPYEEFKQNPYTVLCTTDWGGHLSWFQPGGKRWFATAIAAFLTTMHSDIDMSELEVEDVLTNDAARSEKTYPIWDPTNRRLTVPP